MTEKKLNLLEPPRWSGIAWRMSCEGHVEPRAQARCTSSNLEPRTKLHFSVNPELQTVPCLLDSAENLPSVSLAAAIHFVTALLTQSGMGTVRM